MQYGKLAKSLEGTGRLHLREIKLRNSKQVVEKSICLHFVIPQYKFFHKLGK